MKSATISKGLERDKEIPRYIIHIEGMTFTYFKFNVAFLLIICGTYFQFQHCYKITAKHSGVHISLSYILNLDDVDSTSSATDDQRVNVNVR